MQKKDNFRTSIGEFAIGILNELPNTQNTVFSPASIYSSLALASCGANNNTLNEFQNILKYESNQDLSKIIGQLQKIVSPKEKGVNVVMGNKIFLQSSSVSEEYLQFVLNNLYSSVENVNFNQNSKVNSILDEVNKWVSQITNGKINEVLPQGSIDIYTRLILVNAIYFQGDWKYPFDASKTQKLPFFIEGKKNKNVPMMNITKEFSYLESETHQFISIPYIGDKYSLAIFLPSIKFTDYAKKFSYSDVIDGLEQSTQTKISLTLPRFKIQGSSSSSLKEVLKSLGLRECFTEQADLTGIDQNDKLQVSDILHKAIIVVNEEGTEAAAATATVLKLKKKSLPCQTMNCNKPFIYAIVHQKTHCVLFMGKVINPCQD